MELPVPALLLPAADELGALLLELAAMEDARLVDGPEARETPLLPALVLLPLPVLPLLARLLPEDGPPLEDAAAVELLNAALEDTTTPPEDDVAPATARHNPSVHRFPWTQSPSPLQGCAHPSSVATVSPSHRWLHASTPGTAHAASRSNHPGVGL